MVPNMAVVAPIPMARVTVTAAVKPGLFLIIRAANFRSAGVLRNIQFPSGASGGRDSSATDVVRCVSSLYEIRNACNWLPDDSGGDRETEVKRDKAPNTIAELR